MRTCLIIVVFNQLIHQSKLVVVLVGDFNQEACLRMQTLCCFHEGGEIHRLHSFSDRYFTLVDSGTRYAII